MIISIQSALSVFLSFIMMIFGSIIFVNHGDTIDKYVENVNSVEAYSNDIESAVPMTDIYSVIENHFNAPLPEGKTEKKVLVLGYDGCRADALTLINDSTDESAINYLLSTGAQAQLGYCGGVNYPAFNTQKTSTAPGWCSMLTGEWSDVHGIKGNGIVKSNEHLTLLTSLVEDKIIDTSAFYVSWNGHFVEDDSTYILEKQYCSDNNLDVIFNDSDDDDGTYSNTLSDITADDCSDFIFTIFEYTDHAGHDSGFSIENPDYAEAFADVELQCRKLIRAVEERETYESEDWLIIITSDHGGYNIDHGFLTIQERLIFFVIR